MKIPNLLMVLFGVVLGIAIGLLLDPLTRAGERGQVALWIEVFHRLCTGIGGLGTFAALIVVLRQFNLLRTQSALVQKNIVASMDAQLYSRLDSFNRFVFEHYKEYDALDQPFLANEPPELKSKLHRMCELGFTFFEEIFKHHSRLKLLETEDWDEWEQNMDHFFVKPYVRGYWERVSGRYSKSFRLLVDELVTKLESQGVVPTRVLTSPSSVVIPDPAA